MSVIDFEKKRRQKLESEILPKLEAHYNPRAMGRRFMAFNQKVSGGRQITEVDIEYKEKGFEFVTNCDPEDLFNTINSIKERYQQVEWDKRAFFQDGVPHPNMYSIYAKNND